MSEQFFDNRELSEVWNTLSPHVRETILQSGVHLRTPEQLRSIAQSLSGDQSSRQD